MSQPAVAVPVQLNYADTPPVAIESRPQRRLFFPTNGQSFSPDNTNQIRIDVNADSMLDFSHSYLQFDLSLTNKDNVLGCFLDVGCPVVNRLQIESGGVVLEDIQEWNRLYAMLCEFQGDSSNNNDWSLTQNSVGGGIMGKYCGGDTAGAYSLLQGAAGATGTTLDFSVAGANTNDTQSVCSASVDNSSCSGVGWWDNSAVATATCIVSPQSWDNWLFCPDKGALADTDVANGQNVRTTYKYNVPLMCGLGMLRKYFPLIFLNQGITIVLHLESGVNIGAWLGSGVGAADPLTSQTSQSYTLSNVRFCGHLVDLDRSFYERLRSTMEASGGVMTLSSTTYRHFTDQVASGSTSATLNIPARIKSIKALLVKQVRSDQDGRANSFNIGQSTSAGLNEYSFRVGAVKYPPQDIAVGYGGTSPASQLTNGGEVFQEVRKAFGTIGAYDHKTNCKQETWTGSIAKGNGLKTQPETQTYIVGKVYTDDGTAPYHNSVACCKQNFMFAFDFEGFSKSAIQSGLNSQDRSLPITLETKYNAENPMVANVVPAVADGFRNTASALRVDTYAMCDILFYIDASGNITSRI